ncbi:MAG TPA: hypothetical protein VGJ79_08070 [Candidatus Dormibacteraeota bacterium]
MSATRRALTVLAAATFVASLSSCQAPFDLGQPSTRALENGAADSLAGAKTFEITGTYTESADDWTIDMQVVRSGTQHLIVSHPGLKLEAILFLDPAGVIATEAYFRGNQYLSDHMGTDTASRNLVKAAGNAWWKGSAGHVPQLPDLTDGAAFRAAFLGTAVTNRTDHVVIDGIEAVNLSGVRADVFIAATAPHRLLHVRFKTGAKIDGVSAADFKYGNFDTDFKIAKPSDVIDFSNLSTLPPIYTVVSVDTSRCGATCVVSAVVKNLGGKLGAQAKSTIAFTMTDSATKATVGGCQAQVVPDVGYNATTTVSCTISSVNGQQANAAIVTATPTNPGRA